MLILRFVLLYFIYISLAIFISYKLNRKTSLSIPIAFIVITLLEYIFGLIQILEIGTYIIATISILLGIFTLIKLKKDKKILSFFKENIFNIPTLFFTIIFIVLGIYEFNKILLDWDQFTFWSYYTKNLYETNNIYISRELLNINNVYPPIPNILEYFNMKIIGTYTQGLELFTTQLFAYVLLFPLFESSKKKLDKIGISAIIICLPIAFVQLGFYKTSYADTILGLLIGFILFNWFKEDNRKALALEMFLAFAILSITKSVGILIAGILIISLLIYEVLKTKKFITSKTLILYATIMICALSFGSWKIYEKITYPKIEDSYIKYETNGITYAFNSYKSLFTGEGNEIEQKGGYGIMNMFGKFNISYIFIFPFNITSLGTIIIYLIFAITIFAINKKKKILKNTGTLWAGLIGFILYVIMLQLAYLIEFSETEMLLVSGFGRYISTFFIGMFYLIFGILINIDFKRIPILIALVCILLMTPIDHLYQMTIGSNEYNEIVENDEAKKKSEELADWIKNIEKEKKILLISYNRTDISFIRAIYLSYPREVDYLGKNDIYKMTKEEFDKKVNEYDYVYKEETVNE